MAFESPFFRRTAAGVAITLFLASALLADARADESGSVSGTVSYDNSKSAITSVNVAISGFSGPRQIFVKTDRAGNYNAVGLDPGHYRAVFTRPDLETEISAFEICPGSVTRMDILMIDAPRVCGMCPFVRTQPRQMVLSTSSTVVTNTQ